MEEHHADTPNEAPHETTATQPQEFGELTSEDRSWGMYAHLAALAMFVLPAVGNVLGPLIVWSMKKDTMPFVDDQGKEALNFQITVAIAMLISSALILAFFIGCILIPLVYIGNLVFIIQASMAANRGETYRYPFTLRFFT